MDNIADIVCRGLSFALPDGEDPTLLACGLASVAIGYLRANGSSIEEAREQLIRFIRTAPLDDLQEIPIADNG